MIKSIVTGATFSMTPDSTPFGERMVSPIHCIYTLPNFSILNRTICLWINDIGVCVWMNLTGLFLTYMYYIDLRLHYINNKLLVLSSQ